MAKIKNVSGEDLLVPGLGGRLVLAGEVVEVNDDEAESYTCQGKTWKAHNPEPPKGSEPQKEG